MGPLPPEPVFRHSSQDPKELDDWVDVGED